ncbi:SGNH/GDSL hydrolase family protein [Segetibacter aerophilus]|uniref:Lysophospholipase n=1 Tax=Segetibacter aerophilus TaxID=670293 RepID=A0A512BBE7_9BACT|nr:SGNH/GDSL hydrolase family protein [Segetibacter aerophilus]GEO09260.1 lysophospholipase [Segetibacter aerophilus]
MINSSPANPPTTETTSPAGLKYLALGDSYTIGQSVQESERFPAQTVRLLASNNISVETPQYIATTGWTTANLINAINAQNPPKNFDIVTLLIGVNDQYQHMDTSSYRIRFTTLLNMAIAFAANRPSRVFVLSIPDYSATPYVSPSDKGRVSFEIDQFNEINKQITLANNVAYVDITPASREATTDPALVANDGLHPSGKQYARWSELLAPMIKNALK